MAAAIERPVGLADRPWGRRPRTAAAPEKLERSMLLGRPRRLRLVVVLVAALLLSPQLTSSAAAVQANLHGTVSRATGPVGFQEVTVQVWAAGNPNGPP